MVEESSTSAVFSLAMVIVYDECIISQVIPVQTLLICLVLSINHTGGGMTACYIAVHELSMCGLLSLLLIAHCPITCMFIIRGSFCLPCWHCSQESM